MIGAYALKVREEEKRIVAAEAQKEKEKSNLLKYEEEITYVRAKVLRAEKIAYESGFSSFCILSENITPYAEDYLRKFATMGGYSMSKTNSLILFFS